MKQITAITLLCCAGFNVIAQQFKFSRISSEQGLSQASVNCILQDSKGFVWFGTQDGLNKYNGYAGDMVVYKHDPTDTNSLSNNNIECLFEDADGMIWVGTRGGGLNRINPFLNRITRYENDPENDKSISSNHVKCIVQDVDGQLWIGTTHGLNVFSEKGFKRFVNDPADSTSILGLKVEEIYIDKKQRLWVCTIDGGVNLFDRKTKGFRRFIDRSSGFNQLYYNRFGQIVEDDEGKLLIATDNGGLVKFDPETGAFLDRMMAGDIIPENRISALVFDDKGTLWVGTKNSGIVCINNKTGQTSYYRYNDYDPQSLSNDGVNCIYRDREGNMWVGIEAGGVSVTFPKAARFQHFHKDIANEEYFRSNTVFALMQDSDGLLWVGTMHGGLTTIDRMNNAYANFGDGTARSLSRARSNSVLSLYEDPTGLIWVGTWGGGVTTYDKTTGEIGMIIDRGAFTSITGGRGKIWMCAYGSKGLYAYDLKTKELKNISKADGMKSENLYCVFEDAAGIVWVGSADAGLHRYDPVTGKIEVFQYAKDAPSISDNTVNCLFDDGKGNLWIGTSKGLNKMNKASGAFVNYYEKDGLPNGNIWGILGDRRGNLWISTNKGISRFNPNIENVNGSAFKNFSTHDGLQGDEFAQGSYFLNKGTGEMFFGGINGFNAFFPDNIQDNDHVPPVHITSFKIFGKEFDLDSSISDKHFIELSYKDNFISFEFVALDFIYPQKNLYSFTLDGLEDVWSPASPRRYVSFTNLPGGDYVFRVKGSNSDGVWNETGTAFHIRVIPPWWKTNSFYAGCILFLIIGVFGFIRIRTASIQKEKRVLEVKVAERTAELAQKNQDITASIQYAKRIQQAILPTRDQIQRYFPDSFVMFKPKDIVSGDFYWFGEKNGKSISACVDCTGHGVPGAFMSMIGTNLLNQIILEKGVTEPAAILAELNAGVRSALKQGTQREIETTDGMDIALCTLDLEKRELQFASALRHLVVVSGGKLDKVKGDKFPIGGAQVYENVSYTNHIRFLKKGDMIYMFSDGFADQFGGDKGKKYMIKKLYESLLDVSLLPMLEQRVMLEKAFEDWKGSFSQVDDVLVIGIRL